MAYCRLVKCDFIPFLAGAMLNNASNVLAVAAIDLAPNLRLIGLVIAALALSLLPRQILLVVTTIGVLASLVLANVDGNCATCMASYTSRVLGMGQCHRIGFGCKWSGHGLVLAI